MVNPINAGDTAWILVCCSLVLLMTPALALFYGGMVRRKNVLSTLTLSYIFMALIGVQWVVYGYSLAFGLDIEGLIGGLNFVGFNGVDAVPNGSYSKTIPHSLFAAFQMMFAVITPALITGAFVERVKFKSFLLFSLIWATLVYDPLCHWVWGQGGWLKEMGVLDFAGGTVVHIAAGFSALAFALVIGPRKGFGKVPMEPNNIPLTVLGAGLLWVGWFGFNAGSALAANGVAVNALLTPTPPPRPQGSSGCSSPGWTADPARWGSLREWSWAWRPSHRRPDMSHLCPPWSSEQLPLLFHTIRCVFGTDANSMSPSMFGPVTGYPAPGVCWPRVSSPRRRSMATAPMDYFSAIPGRSACSFSR
jgi:hypothetical protein